MAKIPTGKVKKEKTLSESMACLEQRIREFEDLLGRGASNEEVGEFDENVELFLSDVFGNPSEILEAYTYAQLGEAAGFINLPEEGQLEGDQDVERQSLQQRKAVLEQGLAELKAMQGRKKK